MNAQMQTVDGIVEEPTAMVASATTPAHLLAMAVSQGADLDRLERLMALQERWEAGEARKAFTVAMTAFKAETIEVLKRKLVKFETRTGETTYMHAELSDVVEAVTPGLAKNQLSHRWDIRQEPGSVTVDCILTHAAGHSERITMSAAPDDSGGKNKIQMIASTVTYLERYTLLAITGVATKGMDDDGRASEAPEGAPSEMTEAEQVARRKAAHDAAHGRHSESITFIKERLAAGDLKAAVGEWEAIAQTDQMALWLAPTKGGCLTTEERKILKEKKL